MMNISKDIRLKIIGLGKVGMSIAQSFAQSGLKVHGIDINQANIDRSLKTVEQNLDSLVLKRKITAAEKDEVLSRMDVCNGFDRIEEADVVIESVFEDIDIKKEVFRKIDKLIMSQDALLLTNTSSLSVTEIASVTKRPEMVAGMHFFYPVPLMKLVEVVRGTLTSGETIAQVKRLAELLNKTPIVSADSPGFIVNRLLNALSVEASRIVEEGVGSIEDVDKGARLGLGHPMGPFELFDYLSSLHLLQHVTEYMAMELGERFRLPVWVKNLVKAGKLGRDSGRGFYDYSDEE